MGQVIEATESPAVERPQERLRQGEREVRAVVESFHVLQTLADKQVGPHHDVVDELARRQNLVELRRRLRNVHPADVAHVFESIPQGDKVLVWRQLEPAHAAAVLLEASPGIRGTLLAETERKAALSILRSMDADDLAFLADDLPADLLHEVSQQLDARGRSWIEASADLPDDSVGRLMVQSVATLREGLTIAEAVADLRRREEPLPRRTEALCVVDARRMVRGIVPLRVLLLGAPEAQVATVMTTQVVTFYPTDRASDAADAFERYDLVSAPVVDERGKLMGRVVVDEVMEFVRRQAELEGLRRAGLAGDEDLFASGWASAKNRWLWLAVNLATAFVATRVIGVFEDSIARLVALATLMPMVASIGGNTGNQTTALVVRALALQQLTPSTTRHLILKELTISLLNGAVWGGVMGVLAFALYGSAPLGGVMAAAVLLNLIVAALVGTLVPLLLHAAGRDPAQGASVLLTFTTDGMGFFLFLALATWFLL